MVCKTGDGVRGVQGAYMGDEEAPNWHADGDGCWCGCKKLARCLVKA